MQIWDKFKYLIYSLLAFIILSFGLVPHAAYALEPITFSNQSYGSRTLNLVDYSISGVNSDGSLTTLSYVPTPVNSEDPSGTAFWGQGDYTQYYVIFNFVPSFILDDDELIDPIFQYGTYHFSGSIQPVGDSRYVQFVTDGYSGVRSPNVIWSDDIGTKYSQPVISTSIEPLYNSGTHNNYVQVPKGGKCYFDATVSVSSYAGMNSISIAFPVYQSASAFNGSGGWALELSDVFFISYYDHITYALYNTNYSVLERLDQIVANTSQNSITSSSEQQLQSSTSNISTSTNQMLGLEDQVINSVTENMQIYSGNVQPDTTMFSGNGVGFVLSCINLWWNGLGALRSIFLICFAVIIFNAISRYRS